MSVSGALSLLMLRLGKLLSCMIIFKLLFQDLPQQVCIVAYLHAWYSPNGMRCQMCLFHPSHCDNVRTRFYCRPKVRQRYFDDEVCFLYFIRAVIFSVSVLLFSTGEIVLSRSALNLNTLHRDQSCCLREFGRHESRQHQISEDPHFHLH